MHGRRPKSDVVREKVNLGKAENLSLLPALCIDGYIACNIYRGAVTRELFESFILEDVLPKCGRYPGPKSIIVMDNAKIHCKDINTWTVTPFNMETNLEYQKYC